MNRLGFALFLALLSPQCSCRGRATSTALRSSSNAAAPAISDVKRSSLVQTVLPEPPALNGPLAIHSNTTHVAGIAGWQQTLWVATRGGLEEYDLPRRVRVAVYTTRDGLPTLFMESVAVTADGLPVVTTAKHQCTMHAPSRRFACTTLAVPAAHSASSAAFALHPKSGIVSERIEGVRVTVQYRDAEGHAWHGTAGLGVWERAEGQLRRLTPIQQIVSNHVVAIAEWKRAIYFASFDSGLGRLEAGQFSTVALNSTLLNDVLATPNALYVAASDGLYVSFDGEHFRREERVTEPFVSDLAYDAPHNRLYATATSSLWELELSAPTRPPRAVYLPGGSRSLQGVDVSKDGTVYLATEDRGVLRRTGKRRFDVFDRMAGYPSSWATDVLALDAESALFGSLRHGAFTVGGKPKDALPLDPWILFLGRDALEPEHIFVGTQGGAAVLDGPKARLLEGLPNPCVHAMARLSSGLWVGTEAGLAQYR